MKFLLPLMLIFFTPLLSYGQNYERLLFKGGEPTLIKNQDNDFFIYGLKYNPGASYDVYFSPIDLDNGDYDELNYIGTNNNEEYFSIELANSGNEFVFAHQEIDNYQLTFGLLDFNGEIISSSEYPAQPIGKTLKVVHGFAGEFIILTTSEFPEDSSKIFINKFGINGDHIWTTELGASNTFLIGSDIIKTQNNSFIVIGSLSTTISGNRSTAIFEISNAGNINWEMEYAIGMDSPPKKIKKTPDHHYSILINEGPNRNFNPEDHIKVLTIDTNGSILDSVTVQDDQRTIHANDFIVTENNYVFAGYSFPGEIASLENILIKANSSGETIWSKDYPIPPPTNNSSTFSCFVSIHALGNDYLISGDWSDGSFGWATLYRVNSEGLITSIIDTDRAFKVDVFPNPANEILSFKPEGMYQYDIGFYDINGKMIKSVANIQGDFNQQLNELGNQPSMVVQIEIEGQLPQSKIILLHD